MRIAVVTTSYPAFTGDASGHFVRAEAEALAQAGHDVDVYHPARELADTQTPLTGRAHSLPLPARNAFGWPGFASRLASDPRAALGAVEFGLRVRRALERARPYDAVVAHWLVPSAWPVCNSATPSVENILSGTRSDSSSRHRGATRISSGSSLGWLGELCAAGRGMPASLRGAERTSVAHGSDVRLLCRAGRHVTSRVVRSLLDGGGRVRFVSEPLRDQLVTAVGEPLGSALRARSSVLAVPVALEPRLTRHEARARLGIDANERVAVVVGRLVPGKRPDVALAACTALPGCVPYVIGEGPLSAALRARFPSATFLGQLPRETALAYIAAANVLVSASEAEGSPTAIREALALGTPVAAVPWGPSDPAFRGAPGLHLGTDLAQLVREAGPG